MTTPSQQLRQDLDALINLAQEAPPDECGWGWQTLSQNIESRLRALDQEFASLMRKAHEPVKCTTCRCYIVR